MDEWGCFHNNERDYKEILKQLNKNGAIVFSWAPSDGWHFIVLMSRNFKSLGMRPYNQDISGQTYVAFEGNSSTFHFELNSRHELHPSFIRERLNCSKKMSDYISTLLHGIMRAQNENRNCKNS